MGFSSAMVLTAPGLAISCNELGCAGIKSALLTQQVPQCSHIDTDPPMLGPIPQKEIADPELLPEKIRFLHGLMCLKNILWSKFTSWTTSFSFFLHFFLDGLMSFHPAGHWCDTSIKRIALVIHNFSFVAWLCNTVLKKDLKLQWASSRNCRWIHRNAVYACKYMSCCEKFSWPICYKRLMTTHSSHAHFTQFDSWTSNFVVLNISILSNNNNHNNHNNHNNNNNNNNHWCIHACIHQSNFPRLCKSQGHDG